MEGTFEALHTYANRENPEIARTPTFPSLALDRGTIADVLSGC